MIRFIHTADWQMCMSVIMQFLLTEKVRLRI